MQRIVLSSFSVLLATFAMSPMAQAAEAINKKELNIHQLRIENLANRNKDYKQSEGVSVQTLHLEGMDRRNKSYDRKESNSLQAQRLERLDRNNKASLATVPLIEQRQLVLERSGSK